MLGRNFAVLLIVGSMTTQSYTTQKSLANKRSVYNSSFSNYTNKELASYAYEFEDRYHDGQTPLHRIVTSEIIDTDLIHKRYEILVEWFLRRGIDVNARDADGQTAVHYAGYGVFSLMALPTLLYYGADINAQDDAGATGLIRAARCGVYSLENLKHFIAAGADLNIQDKKGNTALFYAVQNASDDDHRTAVRLLIYAKADLNKKNKEGKQAFDVADQSYLAILVAAGADSPDMRKQLEKMHCSHAWHDTKLVSIALGFVAREIFKHELNGYIVRSKGQYLANPYKYPKNLTDCILERYKKIEPDTYQPDFKTREKFYSAYTAMKTREAQEKLRLQELHEKKEAERKEQLTQAAVSSVPQPAPQIRSASAEKSLSSSDQEVGSDDKDSWLLVD